MIMSKENKVIRYGRCVNEACSNYGISDIMPEDGKCPVCGKEMELDEDVPPVAPPEVWPRYVAIALAVLLVVAGAIYGIATFAGASDDSSVEVEQPIVEEPLPEKPVESVVPAEPTESGIQLKYGVWTGDLANNQPNGTGTLTYKVRHRIDSRDVKERVAEAGDYIIGEFSNGKLVQGVWYDKNNNQKGVIIIGK